MRKMTKPFLKTVCIGVCAAITMFGLNQSGQLHADTGAIVPVGNDDVLDHIPASADFVEVFNNLSAFHDKLGALAQKLQIPWTPRPVGFYAAKMGITEGLDVHGSAAVIIPKLMPGSGEPVNGIILFPTTDPEKVLSAMNPASVQNGISSVQPHNTMPGFAAVTGHYVAFSINQQTLADFLASKQSLSDALSASDVNMIDAGDMGFYINVASIREPAEKTMDANFANSMQMFQAMGGAQNQKMVDQAQFGLAIDKMIIHEVLDDVKTGVATITISDDGISIDMDHQFESGTPLADFLTDSKPLGDKPFAGLPAISPTMAVSINMSGGWLSELLKKWSDGLANDPNLKSNVQAQQTAQQWDQASQVYKLVRGQAQAISLNPTVKGFSLTTADDPNQVLDLERQIAQESVSTLQLQNNNMTGFNMNGQFTQNALTVDNVSFDKFVFNITSSAQASSNPGSVMVTQFLQNLLGPDGLTVYTGIQGSGLVAGINTSNDELQSAVEAAKSSADTIDSDSSIVAAQQHVLPDASIVAYGQPSAIFEALLNVFRSSTGMQSQSTTPSGALTLTASPASFSQSGSLSRIYLPTSELEQISNDVHELIPMIMMMSMSQQQQQPIQPRQ